MSKQAMSGISFSVNVMNGDSGGHRHGRDIDGDVEIDSARGSVPLFLEELDLVGVTITGCLRIRNCDIQGDVNFSKAHVARGALVENVVIHNDLIFSRSPNKVVARGKKFTLKNVHVRGEVKFI